MKFFLFIYGTILGSFLPVLVQRFIAKQNFIWDRSHCDTCHRTLRWFELIPIVSFLCLRGKFFCCKTSIPLFLLVYEISSGLLFTLFSNFSFPMLFWLLCLEIISLFDLFTFQFNSLWLLVLFGFSLLASTLNFKSLILIIISYLILIFINQKLNWIGNGDIDVLISFLIVCPFVSVIHTICLASLSALLFCWFKKTNVVPFIPFLFNSLIVILFIDSVPVTI